MIYNYIVMYWKKSWVDYNFLFDEYEEEFHV